MGQTQNVESSTTTPSATANLDIPAIHSWDASKVSTFFYDSRDHADNVIFPFVVGCDNDNECPNDEQCYNSQCINPCILGDPCSRSAECYGTNHRSQCRCPPGYAGDPFDRCERIECRSDSDCPNNRACLQQRCIDPCSSLADPPCAQNAICYAQNHAAGCQCPPHLPQGNPMSYCQPPVIIEGRPECELDVDCPSKLACIKNRCLNPCVELSACHSSAHCSVVDTVPIRTMICTCPVGWVSIFGLLVLLDLPVTFFLVEGSK